MSAARIARARKLLAVETSRVAAREAELAAARRVLEDLQASVVRAEAEARAGDTRWLEADSADDLARASAHRRSLEARVVRATIAVTHAVADVKTKEAAAIAARIAERRFEILIEGFVRADSAREQKIERRAADEHAARRREVT